MAGYDLEGARQAGVPDAEIAAALAPKLKYDLEGARKAGVPDADIVTALVGRFNSTEGGAATGNPSLAKQGDKTLRNGRDLTPVIDIGGATAVGGALGAAAPEMLSGAGRAIGAVPQLRALGKGLEVAGDLTRAAGRPAAAAAGAMSGAMGETAGQAVEAAGGGTVPAEAARIVGGGIGPELKTAIAYGIKKFAGLPVLSDAIAAVRKYTGREGKLTEEQEKYLAEQVAALRGGPQTQEPLEKVGTAMENYGRQGVATATGNLQTAERAAGQLTRVEPNLPDREFADIGGSLRDTITKRNQGMLDTRAQQYKDTEKIRDSIVAAKENNPEVHLRQYVSKTPEFNAMVDGIRADMPNRSPDVQRGMQKILSELQNPEKDAFGQAKPTTFQALDDVRRKLGEVFKGKPSEGYDAIGDVAARDLYAKITNIQKKFAGGETGPHASLLADYHNSSDALAPFRAKTGKKATALDLYDDSQFATDASTLPAAYFKSRASISALKELAGDDRVVTRAATEYVNKHLEDASAADATKFLRKNSEWLSELPTVRKLVENHAQRLEGAERGLRQATTFADEAASTNKALLGGRYPVDRVRNLVQNGNMDLWERAGPAIAASPEGKANVLSAVRQVLADKPMDPAQFAARIRPALKGSGLADDAALDGIEAQLRAIKEMNVPEAQKLGIYRRVALQAIGGYTASGTARGAVEASKMVPQ